MEELTHLEKAICRLEQDEDIINKTSNLLYAYEVVLRDCHDTGVDFDEVMYTTEGLSHILRNLLDDSEYFIDKTLKEIKKEIKKGNN